MCALITYLRHIQKVTQFLPKSAVWCFSRILSPKRVQIGVIRKPPCCLTSHEKTYSLIPDTRKAAWFCLSAFSVNFYSNCVKSVHQSETDWQQVKAKCDRGNDLNLCKTNVRELCLCTPWLFISSLEPSQPWKRSAVLIERKEVLSLCLSRE